jgi:hypothetical protein
VIFILARLNIILTYAFGSLKVLFVQVKFKIGAAQVAPRRIVQVIAEWDANLNVLFSIPDLAKRREIKERQWH